MKSALLARVAGAAVGIVLLTGCGTSRRAQLERVAKDWCETIRASQVIPVYPLTEDLQPGDVFLVQVPVDRQQEIYKQRGFLPLDNHLARLDPKGYADFYDTTLAISKDAVMPRTLMYPGGASVKAWEPAPSAAFPTYTFKVDSAQGFNLALPISGVPIGMSLMGTQSAFGSVTIDDAKSIGLDISSVHRDLETWLDADPRRREFLSQFGPRVGERPRNYLRVITRVYATGKIDVLLNNAESFAGGLDIGAPKNVNLFAARTPTGAADTQEAAVENFRRSNALINAGLAESMGGGPLSSSGDDANLSEDALTAKVKKRAEERKTRADAEKKKLEDAETAAKPKRDELKAKKAALEAKLTDLAKAEEALASKQSTLDQREAQLAAREAAVTNTEAALAELPADAPVETRARVTAARNQAVADRDAGTTARDAAKAERDAAKTARDTAATAVDTAQGEYADEEKKAAEAEVAVEAARTALSQYTELLPGGSVRVAASSARSVSLQETFTKPLVIGYLAYDIEILPGGGLGNQIPTHALIDSTFGVPISDGARVSRAIRDPSALSNIFEAVKEDQGPVARSILTSLNAMVRFIPPDAALGIIGDGGDDSDLTFVEVPRDERSKRERDDFAAYISYRQERDMANEVLGKIGSCQYYRVRGAGGLLVAPNQAQCNRFNAVLGMLTESKSERAQFDRVRNDLLEYYRVSSRNR